MVETLIPVASGLLILIAVALTGCILLAFVSQSPLSDVVARLREGLVRGTRGRWLRLVLAVTVLAVVLALADLDSPFRVAVTLAFLLAGPGLALAQTIGIDDIFPLITVSIGVSLSLAVVLAGSLLYADIWVPEATLLALAGITVMLVVVAAHRNALQPRQAART